MAYKPLTFLVDFVQRVVRSIRLRTLLLISVLASLALACLLTVLPLISYWRQQAMAELEYEILSLLRANVDATTFPTVADTIKVGERLMGFTAVRGGLVINKLGDELGAFGQAPSLAVNAGEPGIRLQPTVKEQYLDIFFPPSRTGLVYPVVLRVDRRMITTSVTKHISESFFLIAASSVIASLTLAGFVILFVIRPISLIRRAALRAVETPEKAETFRLRWSRRDEIGQTSSALDQLLVGLSVAQQEDGLVNHEALQRCPNAVLTFDVRGKLMTANGPALDMFEVLDADQLARRPQAFLLTGQGLSRQEATPAEFIAEGKNRQICGVRTPSGAKYCHGSYFAIHNRKTQAILYYVLTLVDLSMVEAQLNELTENGKQQSATIDVLRRRLGEQRQLFESCSIIMNNLQDARASSPPLSTRQPLVEIDNVVNVWCQEAIQNGLIAGRVLTGELPTLRGDREILDAIFRQALLAAYSRSIWRKPVMGILAEQSEGGQETVFSVFSEPLANDAAENTGDERKFAAPIATLGLQRALARIGGRMVPEREKGWLSFALPFGQRRPLKEAAA